MYTSIYLSIANIPACTSEQEGVKRERKEERIGNQKSETLRWALERRSGRRKGEEEEKEDDGEEEVDEEAGKGRSQQIGSDCFVAVLGASRDPRFIGPIV
ncbi:hypothetical protein PUN28_016749 [Cardiocondyla obscurior]|uniref:Uncharacterized protein n=1 Tax=Cardiocondyla obscurior TaxID=286306 RepID=A0AAW2ER91_9HYME